jgi:hypothetical protein
MFLARRTFPHRFLGVLASLPAPAKQIPLLGLRTYVRAIVSTLVTFLLFTPGMCAQNVSKPGKWRFAVSGDSRDCGDVVMPAIAAGVMRDGASFYWHLGDFRAIHDFDQDMQQRPEHLAGGAKGRLEIGQYEDAAWQDFIEYQIAPFGSIPVFLGIGNHDTIEPFKNREEFIAQFADWLNTPTIRAQRLQDDPSDHRVKTYYHWTERGVDFINLDNSTSDQFDKAQAKWFEKVVAQDQANQGIRAVVVGMHTALPDSLAAAHSMNDWPAGEQSGRGVYADLLKFRARGKQVFLLASHSHFYMANIFDTEYWRGHGGVLPGWIVGTAGAVRYPLPGDASKAAAARTNVYGYLLATVHAGVHGPSLIDFEFREVREADVPETVTTRFGSALVHQCFANNSEARQ